MLNFEQNTIEIIDNLGLSESQKTLLIEAIEWEKELSWSDGYARWQDVGIKRRLEVQHYKRTFKRATGC